MNTSKRLMIQFLLIVLIHTLQAANKQDYEKAVDIIKKSNLPEFVKNNLIENGKKVKK